jgi:tRNA uracil 4-sulfurtransferase
MLHGEVVSRLKEVPGITYFGVGYQIDYDLDEMCEAAIALMQDLPAGSFKVDTRRSDKTFPLTSPEINRSVGQSIVDRYGLGVDLDNPAHIIRIEITFTGVYLFCSRYRGVGGLPVGMGGNVVSMLSAGFDSPVASWLLMKRGARVYYTHFHSAPYVDRRSVDQVARLVERLNSFQMESVCYMIPIVEIQKKIVAAAPSNYRVLLYRRAMIRLAERIAARHECEAIVTGESLGQVASQTLRNIRIVGNAASLPVLRPLIGMDKEEIIALARRIGTEPISSEPYDDCCTFFMPRQAETWGTLENIHDIEKSLDVEVEYEQSFERAEKIIFSCEKSGKQYQL